MGEWREYKISDIAGDYLFYLLFLKKIDPLF
jgi:hypothetical protein